MPKTSTASTGSRPKENSVGSNENDAARNGLRAVDAVRNILTRTELNPTEERRSDRVVFHVSLDGPADQGIAQLLVDAERFVVHFIFTGVVPAKRRSKVAEFITRANWGLIEGNFEMDFDSGALRYRVGIDFSATELTEPLGEIERKLMDALPIVRGHVYDPAFGGGFSLKVVQPALVPELLGYGELAV